MRSVLEQTYRGFELVVLDNASPDDTGEIARSFGDPRVRVVTNPETIPAPQNWRRVIELCEARWSSWSARMICCTRVAWRCRLR